MGDGGFQRKRRIADAYAANISLREIGQRFGISRQRVEQIAREMGVECRRDPRSAAQVAAREPKAPTITGARLVELIETAASERGVTAHALVGALSPYPHKWLDQLIVAKRPKDATIERIRALLNGEAVPDAPPNNFQARVHELRAEAMAEAGDREERFTEARKTAGKRPVLPIQRETRGFQGAGQRQPETSPEPIDRDPCFRCGVRADVGCRHRPASTGAMA